MKTKDEEIGELKTRLKYALDALSCVNDYIGAYLDNPAWYAPECLRTAARITRRELQNNSKASDRKGGRCGTYLETR